MNSFLAEMYGTQESIGAPKDSSDIEKVAELQVLDESLRSEGVNIETLDNGTILKLASQLFGENCALVKQAEGEAPSAEHEEEETPAEEKKEEAKEKEEGDEAVKSAALAELRAREASQAQGQSGEETFEEKVAQADYLGRVMAHSYWQEKTAIEKQAAMPEALRKGLEAAKGGASKAFGAAKGIASKGGEAAKGKAEAMKGSYHEGGLKGLVSGHKKTIGGTAAGLAVGGAGAAMAAKGKKKSASAIDVLAEKRAMAWAQENGLLEPSDEEKLAAAVDQRAVEMLAEAGIDVAAVEASRAG